MRHRDIIELQVEAKIEEIYKDAEASINVNMHTNKVHVALSCWGAPRWWTRKLIKNIEQCDLQFLHIEPNEETVATGVFEIE